MHTVTDPNKKLFKTLPYILYKYNVVFGCIALIPKLFLFCFNVLLLSKFFMLCFCFFLLSCFSDATCSLHAIHYIAISLSYLHTTLDTHSKLSVNIIRFDFCFKNIPCVVKLFGFHDNIPGGLLNFSNKDSKLVDVFENRWEQYDCL